jgi:hypothetical protein
MKAAPARVDAGARLDPHVSRARASGERAERAVRPQPHPLLQRSCACGAPGARPDEECEACKSRRVQRQAAGSDHAGASPVPPIVGSVLHTSGRPLDAATRTWFEGRLGRDFSDVRIHADHSAAASARAVDALAYTSGPHIVFGAGQYETRSERGRRLLAHELTHVVQQRTAPVFGGINVPGDAAEHEAARNARHLETAAVMSFSARPSVISRQSTGTDDDTTVTVTAPASPPACTLDQHRVIEPAVTEAQRWLTTAAAALGSFASAPADSSNDAARAALRRHFNTADPAIATRVQGRLETINTDLTGRDPFTAECHSAADPSCTNSGAYVPGTNHNMVVFCPDFFSTTNTTWQAGTLIHEMAHALVGLDISDRAYAADRVRPLLSTAEALDNAESHTQLAQELGTGRVAGPMAPEDEVEECPAATGPLIREAIARAQRWNRDAEVVTVDTNPAMVTDNAPFLTTHLGNALPATRTAAQRVFSNMVGRLRSPIDVVCDTNAAAECSNRQAYKKAGSDNLGLGAGIGAAIGGGLGLIGGLAAGLATASLGIGLGVGLGLLGLGLLVGLIVGAATSTSDAVHVCPTWGSQANADDRTESLLAAIYETYAGLTVQQSQNHAALARALHQRYIGAPEPI